MSVWYLPTRINDRRWPLSDAPGSIIIVSIHALTQNRHQCCFLFHIIWMQIIISFAKLNSHSTLMLMTFNCLKINKLESFFSKLISMFIVSYLLFITSLLPFSISIHLLINCFIRLLNSKQRKFWKTTWKYKMMCWDTQRNKTRVVDCKCIINKCWGLC